MRTTYNWITFSLLLLPGLAMAQQSSIETALQKGNAAELAPFFSKMVEISLPGLDDTFTSDKAVDKLTDFFNKAVIKGYRRNHTSTPQEGRSNYSIGDLYTGQGMYRMTIFFDSKKKITEIRIQQ